MINLLQSLAHTLLPASESDTPSRERVAHLQDRLSEKVSMQLKEGHEIAAIRQVRSETGASLKEALRVIHSLKVEQSSY